jgi:hypothetical protein
MQETFRLRSVTAALFFGSYLLLALPAWAGDQLVQLRHKLWRVNSEGQITPFPYLFPSGNFGMAGFGETEPLPSPDRQWVAFGRDSNLYLLNVVSGQERQITTNGKPYKWPYASVEVLISAWSKDSKRILFALVHGETDCPDNCPHDFWIRKAPYGFYTYDLRTILTQRVPLPPDFRFHAWLPDGRFLGTIENPKRKPCEESLLVFQAGNALGTSSGAPPNREPLQVSVSTDGKRAIGNFGGACADPTTRQILKIDLAARTAIPVTPLFAQAENQWPKFSPAAGHIAYIHRDRVVDHIPQESLIVDGMAVYPCESHAVNNVYFGTVEYEWLDEQLVALACRNEMIVQDIVTGTALSHYTMTQRL